MDYRLQLDCSETRVRLSMSFIAFPRGQIRPCRALSSIPRSSACTPPPNSCHISLTRASTSCHIVLTSPGLILQHQPHSLLASCSTVSAFFTHVRLGSYQRRPCPVSLRLPRSIGSSLYYLAPNGFGIDFVQRLLALFVDCNVC